MNRRTEEALSAYIFISPFFIIFAIFGLFPLLYTSFVSLHKWDILGSHEFRSLQNFILLTTDPVFLRSISNTLLIWLYTTFPQLLISLVLAVMLNQDFLKGKNIFRLLVFMPNVTFTVAVALFFIILLFSGINFLISSRIKST
jgi:cellobiose transport system permease protein